MKFHHSVAFGRRIEFWVIGEMMKEGLDVHIPLVDDMGIDAIVRKEDGSFIEAQIEARSKNVIEIQRALVYGHRESWGDAYHFHQFPVRNVSSKSRYGVRACGQPFSWFGRYGNAISPTSMEVGIAHCWGCIGNCECRNEGLNSRKSLTRRCTGQQFRCAPLPSVSLVVMFQSNIGV